MPWMAEAVLEISSIKINSLFLKMRLVSPHLQTLFLLLLIERKHSPEF
jgi:hypothetical protein